MSLDHTPNRRLEPWWKPELPDDRDRALDSGEQRVPPGRLDPINALQPLASQHVAHVASLFREVLPDSLLSHLGLAFLRKLLSSYVTLPGGISYVCLVDGTVVGFIVGAEDSHRHRIDLLRQHWPSLLWQVLRASCLSPSIIGPLAGYLQPYILPRLQWRSRGSRNEPTLPPASLVFLGVAPHYRGNGVATMLTDAFLREMAARGVERVKLTVSVKNREALRFYFARGWQVSCCYRTRTGTMTYRLVYDLSSDGPTSTDDASVRES